MSNTMLSWNEMTEIEKAGSIFWDAFKDAYGFRPRNFDTSEWTLSDFDREIQVLERVIRDNKLIRLESEAKSADDVERVIINLLEAGAQNREMAVKWLMEGHNANGDKDYLCFVLGLKYGYFDEMDEV